MSNYDAKTGRWSYEDQGDGWHYPWLFLGDTLFFIVAAVGLIIAFLSLF